jgi:hypothetical protein
MTVSILYLYLFYGFLCYMIAEGIKYIFSVQYRDTANTEYKYIESPAPQLEPVSNIKYKMPMSKKFKPGDIIQFIFSKNDTPDKCLNRHPARRSISTYGFDEVVPEEKTDYIVTSVEDYGNIPNHKGAQNVEKSMSNVDTFMYVFPKKEYDEMDGMFEHTTEIFWFININEMTICQFEDAYPIYNIASIILNGHRD